MSVAEVETLKVMKFLQGGHLKGANALTEGNIASEFLSYLGEKSLGTETLCVLRTWEELQSELINCKS